MGVGPGPVDELLTQMRPPSLPRSPATSSPSSTSMIASTVVSESPRSSGSRDSWMYRLASARMVSTPTSTPSSSTMGVTSRPLWAMARPTSRTGLR